MGATIDTSKVLASLSSRSLRGKLNRKLEAGYNTPYAVYVHEDLTMNHPRGGQAKYLEAPLRRLRKRMADMVARSVRAKNGLDEGLMRSGDLLRRESKPLVPVDTGRLVNSWYQRVVDA